MNSQNYIIFITLIMFFCSCTSGQEKAEKYMDSGKEKILNNDNSGAIEDFSKVINIEAENYEAFYLRANARFNKRQVKEAIADYNRAIELKPGFAEAYYNRAFCRQFMNDDDGACKDWHKADSLGKPNVKDLLRKCN